MAIAVLVIFWVLVGIGVFLAAMRGGRKHAPASTAPSRMSPGARRAVVAGTAVAFVAFGGVIPALALVHNNGTQAKRSKGGITLSSDQEKGRTLFRANCATCHTLAAAKAVGKVGTNLDVLRPNVALIIDAIDHGRARGQGQMPQQLLQGVDATNVAKYVAAVAGR